jgi:hypothetical protein
MYGANKLIVIRFHNTVDSENGAQTEVRMYFYFVGLTEDVFLRVRPQGVLRIQKMQKVIIVNWARM